MSAWSYLPNAVHIDRVLESIKAHPKVWNAVYYRTLNAAIAASHNIARSAAIDASYYMDRNAARIAARDAAWYASSATHNTVSTEPLYAAQGAILALVAYDDAYKYLDMTPDELKTWAVLSEEPAAILLQPAVIVYKKISELELA